MTKQVLVVRKDLNMRKGKMCAQCAHASLGAVTQYIGEDFIFRPPQEMISWLYHGPFTKIVVGCKDEIELIQLTKKCDEMEVINCLIMDAGKTEFHDVPTYTVLAVGPGEDKIIDQITGHLTLL